MPLKLKWHHLLQLVEHKSEISKPQKSEYRQQYCIIIVKLAKRLDINYSSHKKAIIM